MTWQQRQAAESEARVIAAGAVMAHLRGVTRRELAREAGLSTTTVKTVLAKLRARGAMPEAFPGLAAGVGGKSSSRAVTWPRMGGVAPVAHMVASSPAGSHRLHPADDKPKPIDLVEARAACDLERERWRREIRRRGKGLYRGLGQ